MKMPTGHWFAIWMMNNWLFHARGNPGTKAFIEYQTFTLQVRAHVWKVVSTKRGLRGK